MKLFKRNMVILTVLMFVCVAVYLNWSYNRGLENEEVASLDGEDSAITDLGAGEETDQSVGLYYENADAESVGGTGGNSDYFASARLSRQQARDSAISILRQSADYEGASQEVIDNALNEIAVMAEYTTVESQVESLLIAKGFTECVVLLSDGAVNVIVPAPLEGLSQASVARITDIVTTETGLSAELLKIIEVK